MGPLKRQKGELGKLLGTWLLREVNLFLWSAAVLQQGGTRVALDTVTGMSCELKNFPEVKESGKSEYNDLVQEGNYESAVETNITWFVYQRAQSCHFRG